jgi:adenine deaminase
MAVAVGRLAETGGGQVAVADGGVLAELRCPIGGLLSDDPAEEVAAAVRALEDAARALGVTLPAAFMAMSFLALSVIPELKITDRGYVNVERFELVSLEADSPRPRLAKPSTGVNPDEQAPLAPARRSSGPRCPPGP